MSEVDYKKIYKPGDIIVGTIDETPELLILVIVQSEYISARQPGGKERGSYSVSDRSIKDATDEQKAVVLALEMAMRNLQHANSLLCMHDT